MRFAIDSTDVDSLLEGLVSLVHAAEQSDEEHARVLLGELERVLVLSDKELGKLTPPLVLSFILLGFFLVVEQG